MDIARGFLGIFTMLLVCYLLSNNRKAISWRLVGIGIASQLVLALAVLKIPLVSIVFDTIAGFFRQVLEFYYYFLFCINFYLILFWYPSSHYQRCCVGNG